jgi:2,2-dialkylglycine decarboxylase (pyruvate)
MSREPFFELGKAVYERCLETGLLFSVRRNGSVIRFVPPFYTTPHQLDQAAEILDRSIASSLETLTRPH